MNNKIIYTAIVGGYDDLFEPDFKPDGWDFVCFTDRDFKSDVWDVQKVLPQLVKERKGGYLGVRHDRLVGLLIE